MPRSHRDLDVCLVGHPGFGEIGGVTTWARGLVAALPDLRIGMLPAGESVELPTARVYHAMTPAVARAIAPLAHREGRPVVLTCHAMDAPWAPEGSRGDVPLDASAPAGDPGKPGKGPKGRSESNGGQGDRRHDGEVGPSTTRSPAYVDADLLVAVSQAVAESHIAAGAIPDRTLVIRNGAPIRELIENRSQAPLVGFVGRLAPIKGLERLLRAMREVRSAMPEARLVLIGPDDGPPGYAETLRRLADQPGLRGAVFFTGAAAPELWYPRMTCLALSSETEGMPMAVLEAMSHGVPCIVPHVGGCAEAVGDAGVVVPHRDVDALAGAIAGLLGDASEAARLSALARERSLGWTTADSAAAYAEVYRTVLA